MAEKIILFEANVNMDQALKDTEELRKKTADLKKEADSYRGTEKENTAEHIKAQVAYRASAAELKSMENLLTKLSSVNNVNSGTLSKLSAENAKLRKEQQGLNLETEAGSKRNKEINDTINKNTQFIKENSDSLVQNKMNVGNYEQAIVPLKQQLKEIVQQMQLMAAQGKDDSEEFNQLAIRAGKLKDAMNTANDQIKVFSTGDELEQKIKIAKGSFDALSGAAQTYEGTMQALGIENEDATKGIQKLVALQSIQNGVEQLYNSLQKESAFMLGVKTIQTKAATVAQTIYTTAVGASTGAMKLFRTALLATGIGAIVAGIIALIVNWDKLTGAINGSAKAQEDYNNKIARMNEINEQNKKFNEFSLAILKERGATDVEITNKEIENNKKRQEELLKEIDLTSKKKNLSKEETEDQKKRYNELIDLQDNYILLGIKLEKQKTDELKKQQEERDKIKESQKKKEEENLKKQIEIDNRIAQENLKTEQMWADTERIIAEVKEAQRREARDKEREERKKERERKKEEDAINAQNEYDLAVLRGQMLFDLDRENLALKQQEEIKAAEKVGADVNQINEKYALLNKKITQEEIKFKMGLASQFAGNLATIFGKNTKVGKLAASAQTAIDTYAGAISAYKSLAGIPYVGPVLGAAAAAAVGVAGAKAIKDIWAVKSGLPGDSGGGSSTTPTGGANINPSIGNGIVSRNVDQTNSQVNVTTQPTLVVDDVTEAQQRKDRINKTQAI